MPADLTKPFAPACCEGSTCPDNTNSAMPCGCDKGANHLCELHRILADLETKAEQHDPNP